MITEIEALQYEAGKLTFPQSFLYVWLNKFFVRKCKRNYIRYLGYMEYKKIQEEKRKKELAAHMAAAKNNIGINSIGQGLKNRL